MVIEVLREHLVSTITVFSNSILVVELVFLVVVTSERMMLGIMFEVNEGFLVFGLVSEKELVHGDIPNVYFRLDDLNSFDLIDVVIVLKHRRQ